MSLSQLIWNVHLACYHITCWDIHCWNTRYTLQRTFQQPVMIEIYYNFLAVLGTNESLRSIKIYLFWKKAVSQVLAIVVASSMLKVEENTAHDEKSYCDDDCHCESGPYLCECSHDFAEGWPGLRVMVPTAHHQCIMFTWAELRLLQSLVVWLINRLQNLQKNKMYTWTASNFTKSICKLSILHILQAR